MTLRDYQDRALSNVEREWSAGNSRVCLVSPTGSGKTRMGSEAVHRGACSTIWLTHRNELVDQSAAALRALGVECGEFAANRELTPHAVQVCSWQTLIARPREQWPPCELLVIDECHHAAAEEWRKPLEALGAKRTLGLTATPQRGDGKPLDMFDALVVAASYSALLKAGHLVPCRVFRPEKLLAPDLGSDPLTEYQKRTPGLSAIGFARNEEHCRELAERFTAAGYPSSAITYNSRNRAELIRLFRAGAIKVLWSVQVLTEGFDAPETRVCIVARGVTSVGAMLQQAGRVLRPHPESGKTECVMLDLPGITWLHGLPTEDRVYSLDGRAISSPSPLRQCQQCGYTWEPDGSVGCPECNFVAPRSEQARPRIFSFELQEVWAGAATPSDAKKREWERLRSLARSKRWTIGWCVREFKKLFGHNPDMTTITESELRAEYLGLRRFARDRGYKPGFALMRYKELTGHYPRKEWRDLALPDGDA